MGWNLQFFSVWLITQVIRWLHKGLFWQPSHAHTPLMSASASLSSVFRNLLFSIYLSLFYFICLGALCCLRFAGYDSDIPQWCPLMNLLEPEKAPEISGGFPRLSRVGVSSTLHSYPPIGGWTSNTFFAAKIWGSQVFLAQQYKRPCRSF